MMPTTLTVLRNLTEQLSLRDKELHLMKKLMDLLPIGVYVVNAEGESVYTNDMISQILGRSIDLEACADQLIQSNTLYLAGTEELYPAEKCPIMNALKGTSGCVDDIELVNGDGRVRVAIKAIPVYGESGSITHALSTFYIIKEAS
jgi:PAS domain-containing protein